MLVKDSGLCHLIFFWGEDGILIESFKWFLDFCCVTDRVEFKI